MNYTDDYDDCCALETDDNEDEWHGLLVPKLPVANFKSFDPNQPPVSGEEYLRRVQIEAQNCPEIVVADLDLTKFKSNQTVLLNDSNGFIKAKPDLMPSIEWQRQQMTDFSKIRLKLSTMKEYRTQIGINTKPTDRRPRSMNWWKQYCIGKDTDDDDSDSDNTAYDSSVSTLTETPNSDDSCLKQEKESKPKPNIPLISFLEDMTQEEVIQVLNYHIKFIRQFKFTEHRGVWIYALLVNLEKPLPSEVYSVLRELSRLCSEIRSKIENPIESKILIPLNLIICLIGRYFNQNDMIDQ